MFRKTPKNVSYKTADIENIIGVGLSHRNRFMNYGDVGKENIYTGFAIGRVFAEDQDRLSFEFDAVFLHYLLHKLSESGIPDDQCLQALDAVFENFEIGKLEAAKYYQRLQQYDPLSDEVLAEKLVDNLKVSDFPENFREPSRKILGEQFGLLSKSVAEYVRNELGALR